VRDIAGIALEFGMPVSRRLRRFTLRAVLFSLAVAASASFVPLSGSSLASGTGSSAAGSTAPTGLPSDAAAAASAGDAPTLLGSPNPAMAMQTPHAGCFEENSGVAHWTPLPCGRASSTPLTVGNGRDWVGDAAAGADVGYASGSFTHVSGITGETDNKSGPNTYSLQLNTQLYTCDTPFTNSHEVVNGCWVQFVLQVGPRQSTVFVEFWVIGYYSAHGVCPSSIIPGGIGWEPYQGSCYANSAATVLLVNTTPVPEPISNLANLTLSGSVYTTGNATYDEAVVTDRSVGTAGTSWSATVPEDPLALDGSWHSLEFNVLGFGDQSEALFNTGTSISVTTSIESLAATPIAQTCDASGYSAETSNLSIGSCSTYPPNHLTFTEVNAPSPDRRATFTEKHLPPGTTWWVNVTGGPSVETAGSVVNLWLPRGTYDFNATSTNHVYKGVKGTFRITPYGVSRSVPFTPILYKVTFQASGLPRGAEWCVTLVGGKAYCSTTIHRTFSETNGTYNYTLSTPRPGYSAPAGTFTVNGGMLLVNATFTSGAAAPAQRT
jgi:hypothetical protein